MSIWQFHLLMYGENVKATVMLRGEKRLVFCEDETVVPTNVMMTRTQVSTYLCVQVSVL